MMPSLPLISLLERLFLAPERCVAAGRVALEMVALGWSSLGFARLPLCSEWRGKRILLSARSSELVGNREMVTAKPWPLKVRILKREDCK